MVRVRVSASGFRVYRVEGSGVEDLGFRKLPLIIAPPANKHYSPYGTSVGRGTIFNALGQGLLLIATMLWMMMVVILMILMAMVIRLQMLPWGG